jgi:hypothetical protein
VPRHTALAFLIIASSFHLAPIDVGKRNLGDDRDNCDGQSRKDGESRGRPSTPH